jgi:hypothetical protein
VNIRQELLFEIETAKMRHAWAVAEMNRMGSTLALEAFIKESGKELAELTVKLSKKGSTPD